jgi:ABC-type branched-subunit amino acid transport system substrate-binding protein
MKKFSLLLVLFLFGCQSLTQKLETQPQETLTKEDEQTQTQTHDQFESRNLNTMKANEKKIQVALFLPLSGKNKELGWHLFNAATLSLFENDLDHNIELILIDSKETPDETLKAFKEVVERKIKIVIGPIFSSSIEAIEKDAKRNKITVISLSNNQQLLGKVTSDSGIFLAGMLPEGQIDKIVNYSMDKGKFNFAIIAPNNQYGTTVTTIFKKIVRNRDGNFITSEFYEPNAKNLDKIVDHVINSFTLPRRLTENKGSKLKKDVVLNESDHIYPQIIFIPESGKILSRISSTIKNLNKEERDFQLIGTSQWDEISTLNDPNLVGGWFCAPENEKFHNFEKAYYQTYSKFPPRISSIVYDSVSAIADVIERKKGESPSVLDFINYTNPPKNGFEGIDGLFRFLPNGLVQRNLAVLQVGSGRFETLEKPVEQFLKY